MGLIIRDRKGDKDLGLFLNDFGFMYEGNFFMNTMGNKTVVDTDKFDIIPKESHRKEMLAKKEEEIAALDREWESTKIYYTERRKKLEEEKESILRKKSLSP